MQPPELAGEPLADRGTIAIVAAPSIRPAVPDDADEVERLRVAGWQTAYRGILPDDYLDSMRVDGERRRRHMVENAAAGPGPVVVESVAVQASAIVGWVAGGRCRDADRPGPRRGEIYAIYVLPEWWGRGAGRLLMAHAVRTLAAAGLDDITLWVLEANQRARRFYAATGFRPDGTRQLLDLGGQVPEVRYRLLAGP
jgi:ribosomal protein S18 acetylase RimI-like enzyme